MAEKSLGVLKYGEDLLRNAIPEYLRSAKNEVFNGTPASNADMRCVVRLCSLIQGDFTNLAIRSNLGKVWDLWDDTIPIIIE